MKIITLFSQWDQIHKGTIEILCRFHEEELEYCAYEGGWSVGEIALHIANAEFGWFRVIAAKEIKDWPNRHTLDNYPTLEAIRSLLQDTHNGTMNYLSSFTVDDLDSIIESKWGKFSLGFIIWHIIEHEIHHRGELSLILGTLGREGLDV